MTFKLANIFKRIEKHENFDNLNQFKIEKLSSLKVLTKGVPELGGSVDLVSNS